MNRKQAEHILDAYTRLRMEEADKNASDALRGVILDAMTETRYSSISNYPTITVPTTLPYNNGTIVTCDGGDVR